MRDALPQGYNLNIKASDGSGSYDVRIVTDIGRGGSSFVYKGIAAESIHDGEHTVIVKELFPDIEGVLRGGDNALVIPDDKQAIFEEYKISFIEALQKQRDFYEGYKDQCMPPPFFTGLSGNSLYSVSDPGKGRLLLKINKDELSLGRIASIMRSLSLAISKLHARQMLYLDCKPDNFFYSIDSATEEAAVFLFDFDTVSDIKKLQSGYYRFCSCPGNTQWAAPEQIPLEATKDYEDPSLIGFHTDVYSVGAVFFWLLTGRSPSGKDITKISQDTFDWEGESVFLRNADGRHLR